MLKSGEELSVEGDFAAFEMLPGAVGSGLGDGVVDPAERNAVGFFVVQDALEGRDHL